MGPQQPFGALLRERRRAVGITQRELAERAGVDFSYISKIENDRIPPPAADTVVRLCEILGTPAEEMLARIGKLPSNVHGQLGSSAAAQEFLRTVQELSLSDEEWRELATTVRRFREGSEP
jgi:HTH-type transcriptional regulator, competence development regulator